LFLCVFEQLARQQSRLLAIITSSSGSQRCSFSAGEAQIGFSRIIAMSLLLLLLLLQKHTTHKLDHCACD